MVLPLVDVRRPQENCAVSVLRIGRQFVSFRPGIGKSLLAGRRRVPFPSISKPKRLVAQRIWRSIDLMAPTFRTCSVVRRQHRLARMNSLLPSKKHGARKMRVRRVQLGCLTWPCLPMRCVAVVAGFAHVLGRSGDNTIAPGSARSVERPSPCRWVPGEPPSRSCTRVVRRSSDDAPVGAVRALAAE